MSTILSATCDRLRCRDVARSLRSISIPEPKEDVPSLPFGPEQESNFWFFLVAICHQTSPVGLPPIQGQVEGQHRRGWDYLVHQYRVAATEHPEYLTPEYWSQISACWLTELFGEELTEPSRRAELLKDLGTTLIRRGSGSVFDLAEQCDSKIVDDDGDGLLESLREFEAFSDPLQKKTVFFLALMQNASLWRYVDPENLLPPVDYHEVRGHLRIGTVRIECPSLLHQIKHGIKVTPEDDVEIRLAVRDAIVEIANALDSSPNALHYLFWNLFRTYCLRDSPSCDGRHFATLPTEYAGLVKSLSKTCECPFRVVCASADHTTAINEHQVDTEFY